MKFRNSMRRVLPTSTKLPEMYFSKGWFTTEIGDMDVIAHNGQLHMFHLCLPSHDIIAHVVSSDGMNWQPLPNALNVGDPGSFDDDQIWTMHTFKWQERFYMLYTAMCKAEDGRVQRTGLAVSDDLIRWEKVAHNPVAVPDARWYEADANDSGRADWRDPFAWIEGDTIHGLICAHENKGAYNRRGCVAHIVSKDVRHWEVLPPFYAPGISSDWEVPTMFKIGERYYLIGHIVAPPIDVYRVADSFNGPWQRPLNDVLLPAQNHAFTPVTWRGKTLLYNWIGADFDWHPYATGKSRGVAPPKEAVALPDGQLILKSFEEGWKKVSSGEAVQLPDEELKCIYGFESRFLTSSYADFILEANVTLNAHTVGVLWRSDETADECTRVALIPGRNRIELHKLTRKMNYNAIGRGHVTLQENCCDMKPQSTLPLKVIVWGPYIEVSVNDKVLLASFTMSRRAGQIGLFIEDGKATFEKVSLMPLQPPEGFQIPA